VSTGRPESGKGHNSLGLLPSVKTLKVCAIYCWSLGQLWGRVLLNLEPCLFGAITPAGPYLGPIHSGSTKKGGGGGGGGMWIQP
jgi:hypothetical protein